MAFLPRMSAFPISVAGMRFIGCFKLVQPLAAYCVPTLGDLKDTHTQYTTQGGSRLD